MEKWAKEKLVHKKEKLQEAAVVKVAGAISAEEPNSEVIQNKAN